MYPKIEINLNRILENAKKMKELFNNRGIELSVVVKVLGGSREIVEKLVETGVISICDTHVQNLKKFEGLNVKKVYIREPSISEVEDVIRYSDISLNCEIDTLKELNEEARKQNKIHKVILMYEQGHIREGADKEEILLLVEECLKLSNIEFYGLGSNSSCYAATMPTAEEMEELIELGERIKNKYDTQTTVISGGNSTAYFMVENGELPKGINELRIGEALFLGIVPCVEKEISQLNQNNFVLKAQIVEIKNKPSLTRTKPIGLDSYGDEPKEAKDMGIRKKALIAIGKQDVDIKKIKCRDKDIINLGGSSDYTILDITDSKINYKVGDIVSFDLSYASVLQLMTSNYVEKEIIE